MNVTGDVSDYLQKKIDTLEKLIDRGGGRGADDSVLCDVEIGRTSHHHKSGDVFRTEINIRTDGKYFRAVAEETSVQASIDEAKDQMARELSNFKSKQTTRLRRGGAAIKNLLRGIGSGIGSGLGSVGSGIGGGLSGGFNKIKRINWRRRRRDN